MRRRSLVRAVFAGSVASLASTAVILLCSRVETRHVASGTNATSQWVFGEKAASKNRASLKHTASGYAIHHLMSIFWALVYERHRRRPDRLAGCLRDAALTALAAAIVDFRMMPSRFTPGFEKRLSRKALLLVYVAFAAGLGTSTYRSRAYAKRSRACAKRGTGGAIRRAAPPSSVCSDVTAAPWPPAFAEDFTMPSENTPSPVPYQAIVDQIPDALIFADREGLIRVWNPGAEAVFGFSAAEVLGGSLDVIIPERLRAAHWAAYDRALESGHTRLGNAVRATRAIHKDGRKLYVDLSFGVITGPDGQAVGSVAMGRDCTERYLAAKRSGSGSSTA